MFNFGNVLSNIKNAISPVITKAKAAVASILPKTPQETFKAIQNPIPNVVEPIVSGAFGLVRKGAEVATKGIESMATQQKQINQKAIESLPKEYQPAANIIKTVGNIPAGMTKFGLSTVTGLLHDFAYTGEKLTSPTGRKEVLESAVNLPTTIKQKGFIASLDEPVMIVGLTLSNFLTGGGEEIIGKPAAELVAKGAAKQADRLLAEQVLKEAIDKPSFLKLLLAKPQKYIESILNNDLVVHHLLPGSETMKKVPGGEEILSLFQKTTRQAEIMMTKYVAKLKPVMGNLTDEEFATALDVQRGLAKAPSEKIQVAADAIKNMFADFGAEARDLGIQVRDLTGAKKDFIPLKNYVPQRLNMDLIKRSPDLQAALANYLSETGQITDAVVNGEKIVGTALSRAQKFVDQLVKDTPVRTAFAELFPNNTLPRQMGNLEMERILDLPTEINRVRILDSSKKLITDYIQHASNRIAQVANFGLDNQALNKFQKATAGLPYSDEAVKLVKRAFGLEPRSFVQVMNERSAGKIRQFEALTKLGTSAISNATQSVNTLTSYGVGNTVRSIFQDFLHRPESVKIAEEAGISAETALRDMAQEGLGGVKGLQNLLTGPGFKAVEMFNRRVAANAGKLYAINEFEKLINNPADKEALIALEKFGVDARNALNIGKLSENDLISAARKAVETTQFKVSPMDIPPSWSTTTGRILTQFKSFGYKQSEFILKEILKPAFHGNFVPLTRYVVAGVVAGEAAADIKAVIRGTTAKRSKDPWERAWQNLQQVGGLGVASDAIRAATSYGQFLSWLAGPTVGDVTDLLYEMAQLVKGSPKPILRDITSKIPVLGPNISSKLFPSATAKKTKVLNSGGASFGPSRLGY